MTTVQSTSNTASQALLNSVNGTQNSTTSATDATQSTFMQLLVTQMQNQDPLNPMDNSQVTSQMAQLATVTGVNTLNTTMNSLISSVQTGQSYQASSMIGQNVLVAGNSISTSGSGGNYGINLPANADNVSVTIQNASGNIIKTIALGPQGAGIQPLSWDGTSNDGSVAPTGSYTFAVNATTAGQSVGASSLAYAQVTSIANSTSGITLNLSNQTSVNASAVKEIF